jgi:hypothetical protein
MIMVNLTYSLFFETYSLALRNEEELSESPRRIFRLKRQEK